MPVILNSLRDLYLEQLKELLSAEKRLLEALPLMQNSAHAADLAQVFEQHHEQTRFHTQRLQYMLEDLSERGSHRCHAMEGLLTEAYEIMEVAGDAAVKDAALVATAQCVEHFEIAAYSAARNFARHLDLTHHVDLLEQTLQEEIGADRQLEIVAEGSFFRHSGVNLRAESAGR